MQIEEIVARPRVHRETIAPFKYPQGEGEVVEIRADGVWGEFSWPISVHITVPPGCGVVPPMGDCLKIVVTRDDSSQG